MFDNPTWLFHVSPARNYKSIGKLGISPEFAPKDRMKASWFVPLEKVEWAIIHVSSKYRLSTNEIMAFAVIAHDMTGYSRWMDTAIMTSKNINRPYGSVFAWKLSLDLSIGIDVCQHAYWDIPF